MKKMYGISSLTVSALDNQEFFQLVSDSKEVISAFTKSNKQEAAYANRLPILTDLLTKLEAGLHATKASKVTGSLEGADRERDDALVTLFALVKAFARVKDADSKAAYEKLSHLLKAYTNLTPQSYEKETEGINHLLKQVATSDYQAAVTRLNLTAHVESLKQSQKAFETIYKARLAEQGQKTPSQVKILRHQIQEIYDFLVDFTALTAYAYPDRTAYADLRDKLNVIRDRFKKLQSSKKGKKMVGEKGEDKHD